MPSSKSSAYLSSYLATQQLRENQGGDGKKAAVYAQALGGIFELPEELRLLEIIHLSRSNKKSHEFKATQL